MARNSIRRVSTIKGESRSSMMRYRKHVKEMSPKQFLKEMGDVNDECGGSARMRFLIKHLTAGWRNHLTKQRLPAGWSAVGDTRQRLPLKKIIEKIVESQNIAKSIDEGSLVIVTPIDCDANESD